MGNPLAGVDTSDAPYVIVSSDTHAGLQVEGYREWLDPKYLPQFEEWVVERHDHRRLVEEVNGEYVERWEQENADGLPGAYDPAVRDRVMDADGISAEIIFADGDSVTGQESPPFGAGLAAGQITDPELAFAGADAHNRWLVEFCATDPVRRAGVALVPVIHDVGRAVREVEKLAGQPGIRGVMVPTMWHDKPSYGNPVYDPFWAACADAGSASSRRRAVMSFIEGRKRMTGAKDSHPSLRERFYADLSDPAISAAICATSVGVRPTRTPLASRASCLALAVPAVPDTMAPAWPMVLPGGAVKPAM